MNRKRNTYRYGKGRRIGIVEVIKYILHLTTDRIESMVAVLTFLVPYPSTQRMIFMP